MKKNLLIIILLFNIYSYGNDTLKTTNILIGIKSAIPNYIIGFSSEYNYFYKNKLSIITNISYIRNLKINGSLYFNTQDYSIGNII